jgi:hypothetical protein
LTHSVRKIFAFDICRHRHDTNIDEVDKPN